MRAAATPAPSRRAILAALAACALSAPAVRAAPRRWRDSSDPLADTDEADGIHDHPALRDTHSIVELFLDAALGPDRSRAAFSPWRGAVLAAFAGPPSVGHRDVAEQRLWWLEAATGLPLSAASQGPATLAVLLSDTPVEDIAGRLWPALGAPLFDSPEAARAGLAMLGSCFSVRALSGDRGLLAAPATTPVETVRCLSVGLLGLLGLSPGLPADAPSVLAVDTAFREPTALDRLFAAVATDSALTPNLDEAALRVAVPRLIERHRTWFGFDALSTGAGEPGSADPGPWFAPSARRTLALFETCALPSGAPPGVLLRWAHRAEVPVHVAGRLPAEGMQALRLAMRWIRETTGIRIRAARHAREDGMTLLFSNTLEAAWEEHGAVLEAFFGGRRESFDRLVGHPLTRADRSLSLMHFTVTGGVLLRTLSVIATEDGDALLARRIWRETMRALGLRGTAVRVGHSLLDATAIALQPSELDTRMLRLLYTPSLQPGLPYEMARLQAARLLGWNGDLAVP